MRRGVSASNSTDYLREERGIEEAFDDGQRGYCIFVDSGYRSGHNKVLPVDQVTDDELQPDGAFGICPEFFDH